MVVSDEEYIAESRDPTPEPTPEFIDGGDSPTRGILKNGKSAPKEKKKHLEGEIMNGERVPDMQLGMPICIDYDDKVEYWSLRVIISEAEGPRRGLLIQEAKKTCYGKWYMPAGRVEAGETLENAVKREVREESGYECDVIELLSLEVQGEVVGIDSHSFVK
ncbi:hypothetical protein OSTOST_20042 [Ostertagia ostertagi]